MSDFTLSLTDHAMFDSVYKDYIYLTKLEYELSQTPEFKRLHYVGQIGTGRYVYSDATHVREAHSYGTLYVTDKILRIITRKLSEKGYDVIGNEDLKNFRIAALLHDLGHGPFSHSIEHVLKRNPMFRPKIRKKDNSLGGVLEHEDFTTNMLLSGESEINKKLNDFNVDIKEIINIINGSYKGKLSYFGRLLSGDLDTDRIDYILRDMYHIGVRVTEILPLNKLLSSFDADYSELLDTYLFYIPEKFMPNVDLFLHIRSIFLMAVPLNNKVRGLDLMLTRAVEFALKKEENPAQKIFHIFTKMTDKDLIEYLQTKSENSKELMENIQRNDRSTSMEFKIRNLEPNMRYNFFKLSKEYNLYLQFESKILHLLLERFAMNDIRIDEIDLFIDYNFPEPFPLKTIVRTKLGDYHYYFDYSPLIRGLGESIFSESTVTIYSNNEKVIEYLNFLNESIKNLLIETINENYIIHDSDRLLHMLYLINKITKEYYNVTDPEWIGPCFKGSRLLNECILYLRPYIDFSYSFQMPHGKWKFDDKLWNDRLMLNACGLIHEKLSPTIVTKETKTEFRSRSDFQITSFGKRYVDKYLSEDTDMINKFEDLLRKRWNKDKTLVEKIRKYQNEQETLLEKLIIARKNSKVKEVSEMQNSLNIIINDIRNLKKEIILMVDYREDIF